MLSSLRARYTKTEYDTKFIEDRIFHTEKIFAELCDTFAKYSRKIAKVRDKGDVLVEVLITCAENEDINKSLSIGLTNFGTTFSVINDYGNVRIRTINAKVVDEFSKYESICKQVKEDVKQILAVQEKELTRRKQFRRIRERKAINRQLIQQAESELSKAQLDLSKTIVNVQEKIITFEKQKLHDIKSILLDFVTIEMSYHAKALEQLTKAYKDIVAIDEESDLQDLNEVVAEKGEEFQSTLSIVQSPFSSSQSMGAINTIGSKSLIRHRSRIPSVPSRAFKSEEAIDLSESEETESEQEESSSNTEISTPILTKKQIK